MSDIINKGNSSVKKLLMVFLLLVSALSFILAYQETAQTTVTHMENADERISRPFVIPAGPLFSDPQSAYTYYPLFRKLLGGRHRIETTPTRGLVDAKTCHAFRPMRKLWGIPSLPDPWGERLVEKTP